MFMIPMVIMAIESDTDRAYMTDVYMNHRSLMLKVAWRYTNAPSEVEDIVSESCVSLIQHLDSIRSMEEKTLRSYIVTTVKYNGPLVKTTSKKILVNGRFVRRRQAALKSSSAKVP